MLGCVDPRPQTQVVRRLLLNSAYVDATHIGQVAVNPRLLG
jgi:hypothetical protein